MNLLYSNLSGLLELRRCRESISACPFRAPGANVNAPMDLRRRCLGLDRVDAAVKWLRAAVTHSDDMRMLRRVAAEDGRSVAWMSSSQVVECVAARVARRDLCLVLSERVGAAAAVRPTAPVPASSLGVTPSMLSPRVEEAPVPLTPTIPEFTDEVNHAQQAATLERASRKGAAFCETCEKTVLPSGSSAAGAT